MATSVQTLYTDADVGDFEQCSPQPLKIIHIGCGAAGMLFAYKVRRWLKNYELVIYEKNAVPGGTWYENRYPGCACDVPAHNYTFTFEPNPDWSGFYAYGPEIERYFAKCAKKWNVDEFTKYNTEVGSATWLTNEHMWEVGLNTAAGTSFTDKCHVLVNGSGVVNKWRWPAIPGLHDFKGVLAHSAAWDETIDWTGKKVAVIGTGSSSVQMVPQFAKRAEHLTVFGRNQAWVGPFMAGKVDNTEADPEAQDPAGVSFHRYTEKEKQKFRDDSDYHLMYRKKLETMAHSFFPIFIRGTSQNSWWRQKWRENTLEVLKDHEELQKSFMPTWTPGCRRLSPGDGYLEAFLQPNVKLVREEIVRATASGLVTSDGAEHNIDILACATGFHVQFLPHFAITGVGGRVMQDQTTPNVYASVSCPGFPNYFVVNGPRGNWGQGCALPSHEVQIEYILQCCKKMQEDRIVSMQPRQKLTDQLNNYMDAWHRKNSIWAEDCRSWYKDNTPDGRIFIWPGSAMHHLKYMKFPRFEHYEIEYADDENPFAFLGNGFTINEKRGSDRMAVNWIRNEDSLAWDIE